jgi:hypothetical protein
LPVGSYYGYTTGVVGCGSFPIPFDERRRVADPERYYTDPSYYNDRSLVKPYRVGMSWFLPCRAESQQSAAGSRTSKWKFELEPKARNISGRSRLRLERRRVRLSVRKLFRVATRRARPVRVDRLHEQSADDERRVQLGARMAIAPLGHRAARGGERDNEHLNKCRPGQPNSHSSTVTRHSLHAAR